jgi:GNAT superfamily N-acetyltransferase
VRRTARFVVGQARLADLAALAELQAAAEAAERVFSPDLGTRQPDRRHARRCFKRTIHNAEQRTFVARRLVSQGLQWARRRGARQARLEMASANRAARRLYESFGFAPRETMFTLDLDRGR